MAPARSAVPMVILWKVMAKTFAILSVRGDAYVLVKTDPHLAEMLRGQYDGIGHRTHLDRRFWICIELDTDVPLKETKRLAAESYARVAATLTKAQKTALVRSV
jgi:predicted DNA-binding protein (MmcQ/YjbR family)